MVAPGDIAVAERLRLRWPAELVAAATAQVALRTLGRAKFDRAGEMLFTRAGLEQATPLPVADYRARRLAAALGAVAVSGTAVLDLCCGIGGDTIALARAGLDVTAVDVDPVHATLARHNAAVYGGSVTSVVGDVARVLRPGRGHSRVVHIDPARREAAAAGGQGRRGGYQPSLDWCLRLTADAVCVKVAPGLDHTDIPPGWEAEWVSVGRELKTAVLWSPSLAAAGGNADGLRRATVLDAGSGAGRSLVADPAAPVPAVSEPGDWVVDPDPAVTRAGAVADLAAILDGWLIDPRIAFVVTPAPTATPFGRTLRVEASLPWSVSSVARRLAALDTGDLQIRRRGLAGDVDGLRRRLLPRGAPGGRRVTLLLTRHRDQPWALLCTDPP